MSRVRGGMLLGLLAAVVALAGFAWHYSDMILGPDRPSTLRVQRVMAAGPGRIRLSRDDRSLEPGTWALEWPGGYGALGPVLATDSGGVVREFRATVGQPPVGGWARVRGVARSADPGSMLGLAFRSVRVEGPLGSYPAWFVTGRESTWVIYVHGRAANRAEGLRSLDVLARRGLPGLLITYRNDEGAPRSADGRYRLGLTEWQDLAAAVRYALDHGARDVVIEAYSMGGQIALQFMRRSPLAARVRALVLESPVLDWNATLALRARNLGIPGPMTWLGKTTASARVGLDWSQLDQVTDVRPIRAPVLLFHNLGDHFTPESSSEAFARARPDSVTLIRVARGNHVEAWNADSAGYAAVLGGWLAARGVGAGPR